MILYSLSLSSFFLFIVTSGQFTIFILPMQIETIFCLSLLAFFLFLFLSSSLLLIVICKHNNYHIDRIIGIKSRVANRRWNWVWGISGGTSGGTSPSTLRDAGASIPSPNPSIVTPQSSCLITKATSE